MSSSFILTNQRTGGTALTNFLSEFYKIIHHEPFNKDRPFEKYFNEFLKSNFIGEDFVNTFISNKDLLVKHCSEIQTKEFNIYLNEILKKNNAKVVFLRRKDENLRKQ